MFFESVIARDVHNSWSHFRSNLSLGGGLDFVLTVAVVRNDGVSAMTGCPQGES